jgi:opacity protein-like surface antigen
MNFKLATVALGLSMLAGAVPAGAGDYDYGAGSVKDYGGAGVPVPAPVPLPMYEADWYVRLDGGYAVSSSGNVDVTDPGASGFTLSHSDLDDQNGTASFSAGFGRYITPSLRWDLTIDIRNGRGITKSDAAVGISTFHAGPDISVTFIDTVNGVDMERTATLQTSFERLYSGNFYQRTRAESDTAFFNMYYDHDTGSRFKPYVGAGVGLVRHYLKSEASGNLTCDSVTRHVLYDPLSQLGPFHTYGLACPDDATPINVPYSSSTTGYGLAANIMAGVSTEISPGILLDTGYKGTWMSGSVALTVPTPLGDNIVDIGSRIDHEIRTGLRFDIN